MVTLQDLPSVNAALNGTTTLLLLTGYGAIRAQRRALHAACMLAALVTSTLFLASYLTYHAHVGTMRFPGTGLARVVYLAILVTHTVLAMVIVPLVLRTVYLAARRRWAPHRRLARWTLPLWLYVSATGVIIYYLLYHVTWSAA